MAAKKEKGFLGEKGQGGPLDLSKLKKDKGVAKPKKDPMMDMARKITDRYRVTAREARDIVTAVGTVIKSDKGGAIQDFAKANLKNQIKEVGKAATKGKKGTPSATTTDNGRGVKFKGPRS